ncbi:phage-related tail fiber protein-like protein [Enterobacter cancerogenus]|uniref:Phage-related tail fiber protein-like protein n=1 Tax=Enterobacter cancerogenus TaxID=69218 RepID=A0A484Z7M8_9ENTR|nr:phage-related tail fiber protein-like protein [Enterobacter cancerogenus]
MSQADWEALTALLTGFQSGKAASAQVNKALRQGTVMASVIGQFIADSTGQDVLDNGNTSVVLTNFLNALKANTNGRLLNVRTFTASGTYTPTTGTKKIRVRLVGGGGGGRWCCCIYALQGTLLLDMVEQLEHTEKQG